MPTLTGSLTDALGLATKEPGRVTIIPSKPITFPDGKAGIVRLERRIPGQSLDLDLPDTTGIPGFYWTFKIEPVGASDMPHITFDAQISEDLTWAELLTGNYDPAGDYTPSAVAQAEAAAEAALVAANAAGGSETAAETAQAAAEAARDQLTQYGDTQNGVVAGFVAEDGPTRTELNAAIAGQASLGLAGTTMTVHGDSWSMGYGLAAGERFTSRVAQALGMVEDNKGISGSAAGGIGHLMLPDPSSWPYGWTARNDGALVICAGLNDSRYKDLSDPANASWLRTAKHSLRLACAMALGQPRVGYADPSWALYPGWTGVAYSWSTTGPIAATTTPGTTATINFDGSEISVIMGGWQSEDTAEAEFYIDNVLVRRTLYSNDLEVYPSSTVAVGWTLERFTDLAPGPHQLKIIKADATSALLYVDSYILPAERAPLVTLAKEPPIDPSVYADPAFAPYDQGSIASTLAMHQVIDEVARAFDGVRVAGLESLDYPTDFQADGVHPTAAGSAPLVTTLSEAFAGRSRGPASPSAGRAGLQVTEAGTTVNVDAGATDVFNVVFLTSAATVTTLNISGDVQPGQDLRLGVAAIDAANTVTWPTSVKFAGGTAPTLTAGTWTFVTLTNVLGRWVETSRSVGAPTT